MKSSKWEAATTSLASATRKSPQDLYAWRAYVWLLLYQRKFPAAFDEIHRLAKTFPSEADADSAAEARWQAAAKIMGRAYGYIEGPRAGAVSADDLAARRAKLSAHFTPEREAAFAAGRAELATAHEEAIAAIDSEKQSVVDTKEEEKNAQREFIDSERSRMASEVTSLQEQAESAKSQLDADINRIDQELTPIQQRYSQVQFAAQPFVDRIRELDRRVSFALAEANRNDAGDGKDQDRVQRDRQRRDRAARDADALRFEIRREQEFLRPYQLEIQQLQAAAAILEQQRAAAAANYQRTFGGLQAAQRKLERIEKQLRASERQLAKPVGSTSAKTSDLKARLPLLTTYEKFPLEQERLRLLEEFESP
jgi:chromosome segregation ATPase